MPYVPKTLYDLKISLADRHDSGVLPTSSATLSFWTRLFNKGVEYCADRLRLEKSTTLTTVSGTIALPDDFLIMNRVLNSSNNDLYMTDQNDAPNHTAGYYWITGNQTDGFALNTSEDTTYTIYYAFKPTPLVTDADVCIIPDPEAVVAYAYGSLRRSETDPIEDADKSFQECDARLLELQSASNINNNFTGFTYA